MRNELIFWFDQPPKISLGAYNYVSKKWTNDVIYVVDHPFGEHRKLINWDNSDYGDAKIIMLSEAGDEEKTISSIFENYPDAIHIMNGFASIIEGKIRNHIKKEGIKLVVTTEKPLGTRRSFTLQKWIRNRIAPIKYKRIYNEYKNFVDAVMPLGVLGKELFKSYGWPENKVFSYMYCIELQAIRKDERETDDIVHFLYVGRLNYKTRGLDVIMKAFDLLKEKNWTLDIVGGYGEKKEEVKKWADNKEQVFFRGPWPAKEVGSRMQEYDVYIAPTKADGWASQINEAINAGMGVIVTDEAVSDELIRESGAGKVVRAADYKAFYNAVHEVVLNPGLVNEWRKLARGYRSKIKGDVVGDYFISVLDFVFYDSKVQPRCPWL